MAVDPRKSPKAAASSSPRGVDNFPAPIRDLEAQTPPVVAGRAVVPTPPPPEFTPVMVPQPAAMKTTPADTKGETSPSLCKRLKEALMETLHAHVLFNLCFWKEVREDTAYTVMERIINFIGFLGAEACIVSLLAGVDTVDAAICACIRRDEDANNNCAVAGDELFSLRGDGYLRQDWLSLIQADPEDMVVGTSLECPDLYTTKEECSLTKACCVAFVGSKLETNQTMSTYDPCPENWAFEYIVGHLVATICAAFLLVPFVEWLLRFESQILNPMAYAIVALQVALGVSFTYVFAKESIMLGVGEYAWVSVITSIGLSLVLDTIVLGVLWEIAGKPLYQRYCCCCCTDRGSDTDQAAQPKLTVTTSGTKQGQEPVHGSITASCSTTAHISAQGSSQHDAAYVFGGGAHDEDPPTVDEIQA